MIVTIGHSNLTLKRFLEAVRLLRLSTLYDVRRIPRSRRHPHFNLAALAMALEGVGVELRHVEALGGRRTVRPRSPHVALSGWRAGFAEHMHTPEASAAIGQILALSRRRRVGIMCAESSPLSCHRSLISDALMALGAQVDHAVPQADEVLLFTHSLNKAARVVSHKEIVYDKA